VIVEINYSSRARSEIEFWVLLVLRCWDALWADLVAGVSAENFVHGGKPAVNSELLLEYLHSKVDSDQVRQL
jgi:hypothetical protein